MNWSLNIFVYYYYNIIPITKLTKKILVLMKENKYYRFEDNFKKLIEASLLFVYVNEKMNY